MPLYLRTGKRLPRRSTEVSVHFKRAPFTLFRETSVTCTRADQTFDVMLLGLGEDAYIASIFPESPMLDTPDPPRVAAVWAGQLNAWRITLTPRVLLHARAVLMVVSGEEKAAAVRAALDLPQDVSR